MKNRKMIFLALLVALGIVIGLFENVIALPVALPGAKLGLSNIVVLVSIVSFGFVEGLIVAFLKSILLIAVTGSVSSFIFSFTGAMLSSFIMILALKYLKKYVSLIGVSLLGSAFHNIGQVLAASFILKSLAIFSYLPLLLILGIFTGYFVGLSSGYIVENLNSNFKGRLN
ncbi:Gx transporter family protein [Peptoniphilus sp. oral taxon 386]|uniref:Gx transporter family protein n=1 Tax=Peptoniphilus sp. oral taxon 386 TaxID=652713 RepID=UPI0001DA9ADD|nr:Gx transporter family protein [Peptoniphilus sp. oral taxon 386]EFI42039.1 heptaprenyl diphosphate synthase component I [Peptoniphilus sp. oral taxon 386 str. F0131]